MDFSSGNSTFTSEKCCSQNFEMVKLSLVCWCIPKVGQRQDSFSLMYKKLGQPIL